PKRVEEIAHSMLADGQKTPILCGRTAHALCLSKACIGWRLPRPWGNRPSLASASTRGSTNAANRPLRRSPLFPLAEHLGAGVGHHAIGRAAGECCPAAFFDEGVPIPVVGGFQCGHSDLGVVRTLKLVDADRRQRCNHCFVGALLRQLFRLAVQVPATPAKADSDRNNGANDGTLQETRQLLALQHGWQIHGFSFRPILVRCGGNGSPDGVRSLSWIGGPAALIWRFGRCHSALYSG